MARRSSVDVFCPSCRWEPTNVAFWGCTCGCRWNTFATAGVCPRCRRRWPDTQCPVCHVLSPHEEWYHRLAGLVADLLNGR